MGVKSVFIPLPLFILLSYVLMIRVFLIVFLMPLLSLVTQATAQVNWLTWEEAQERNKKRTP